MLADKRKKEFDCLPTNTEQFNGREGETATLLSRCLVSLNLRFAGFVLRHLKRSAFRGIVRRLSIFNGKRFYFMNLVQLIVFFVMAAALFLFYFLPFVIALSRGHKNTVAIFMLTLLLGWTFLGWIIALIWSFTAVERHVVYRQRE